MNHVKGNVTFKELAGMCGDLRIGGQPDGKRMMMDQRYNPGQHRREQKDHSNRALCSPAPAWDSVP